MTSICSALVIQVVSALLHGNWQDFNWHDALCGPLAIAELLVHKNIQISNQDLILPSLRPVTSLVLAIFRLLEWCSPWGSGIASRLACLETVFFACLSLGSALSVRCLGLASSALARLCYFWLGLSLGSVSKFLPLSCLCLGSAVPACAHSLRYDTVWNEMEPDVLIGVSILWL